MNIRTLSNRELQDLGDELDHLPPDDQMLAIIEERRQRTTEQEEVAMNAIASNRKRKALRQALAKNVPATIAPLDPDVLAQMQADRKSRRNRP